MPTIEFSKKDLEKLTGKKINLDKLKEFLSYLKAELDFSEGKLDHLKAELKDINRPDLWGIEGIARELKLKFFNKKIKYEIKGKTEYKIKVERKVKKARPLIVAAVVKNLKITEETLKQIIQLQEKLSENFGLKRKEAALGIYDFDKINWPVHYTAIPSKKIKFKPLDFDKELTPKEIIEQHEKGKKYGHLIKKDLFPILIDSKRNVLSMPPIINSNYSGKVTEKTKNLFIEVTGNEYRFLIPVLEIMVSALAERGGRIEKVLVIDGKKRFFPEFKRGKIKINFSEIEKLIGEKISDKKITELLTKSDFIVEKDKYFEKSRECFVNYPFYRYDILDSRDVIEEVIINYGYNNFDPEYPKLDTKGLEYETSKFKEKIKEIMIGLGCQEILSFILTNPEKLFNLMKQKKEEVVELENPISVNYSCFRNWLLPSLMNFFSKNKDVRYPQKIFEIGKAIFIKNNLPEESEKLCFGFADKNVTFTDSKQALIYLLNSLGVEDKNIKFKEIENLSFISGRCSEVFVKNKSIGILGEIHPGVLERWKLLMPICAFEIDLGDCFL